MCLMDKPFSELAADVDIAFSGEVLTYVDYQLPDEAEEVSPDEAEEVSKADNSYVSFGSYLRHGGVALFKVDRVYKGQALSLIHI